MRKFCYKSWRRLETQEEINIRPSKASPNNGIRQSESRILRLKGSSYTLNADILHAGAYLKRAAISGIILESTQALDHLNVLFARKPSHRVAT